MLQVLKNLWLCSLSSFSVKKLSYNPVDVLYNCLMLSTYFLVKVTFFDDVNWAVSCLFSLQINQTLQVNKQLICTDSFQFHSEKEWKKTDFLTDSGKSEDFLEKVFDFLFGDVF